MIFGVNRLASEKCQLRNSKKWAMEAGIKTNRSNEYWLTFPTSITVKKVYKVFLELTGETGETPFIQKKWLKDLVASI